MKRMTKATFERSREDRAANHRAAMRKGVSVEAFEGSKADKTADKKTMRKMENREHSKRK